MTEPVGSAAWLEVSLTDVLDRIVDNRGRSCPTEESGFPLIATNCIKGDRLYPTFENIRYISEETRQTWFRGHPIPGDILFVCKGSPGRVALTPDPVSFAIAQDMVALRANPEVIDGRFLFYVIRSPRVQHEIANLHVGTMIPHFKKGDFPKLKFSIPKSVDEQRRIAQVLGSLDDLIEVNRGIIRDLLDTSLAIYRQAVSSSFVSQSVGEVAKFENNKRVPLSAAQRLAIPGAYPYFGAAGQVDSVGEFLFDGTRVLVGEDGTVVTSAGSPVVQFVTGKYWVNNHAHVLSGSSISTELLRVVLVASDVSAVITGAVQPKLSMGSLKSVPVKIPLDPGVDEAIQVLAHAELCLRAEIAELESTRDELLPLLMSGRVRVPEEVAA